MKRVKKQRNILSSSEIFSKNLIIRLIFGGKYELWMKIGALFQALCVLNPSAFNWLIILVLRRTQTIMIIHIIG